MSQKRYLSLYLLPILVSPKGYTLLLCIFLSLTQGSTQDRSTLEAERMNLFQDLERTETDLNQTKAKKSEILSQINNLEARIDSKDDTENRQESVVLPLSQSLEATPTQNTRIKTEMTIDQDYRDTYNALLRQHLRTKLFNESQTNPDQESIQKQIRELSYIKSIRDYIAQNPVVIVENDPMPDFVADDLIIEEPSPESTLQLSPTSKSKLKDQMRQFLNQAAALTDNEITLTAHLHNCLLYTSPSPRDS